LDTQLVKTFGHDLELASRTKNRTIFRTKVAVPLDGFWQSVLTNETRLGRGCQIFLGTKYQNVKKYTELL
jgi:hypothetical protein